MRVTRWISSALLAFAFLWVAAQSAWAADQIYWGNEGAESISHSNIAGGGGAEIPITGVDVNHPEGLAIDSAAGRIYWANRNGAEYSIRFANLDGSGGGILNTSPAPVFEPHGLAIYPAAGRVYWANWADPKIYFAKLDGSGGGELDVTGGLVEQPLGVAVYPAQNRVYWANFDGGEHDVDFASLDGTGGGGTLDLTGANVDMPRSIAIDGSTNRVHWANSGDPALSFASANGGGGGDVFTDGLPTGSIAGIAIDPFRRTIYWAARGPDALGFAGLTGGGTLGLLDTTGATVDEPSWPVLLQDPRNTAAPVISTSPAAPSGPMKTQPKGTPKVEGQARSLSCSPGSWAPDVLESFLYRTPKSISYQWLRNERPIPGATASSFAATEVGDYACRVTASNAAGPTATETAAINIQATFALGRPILNRKKGTARLPVATSGSGVVLLGGRTLKRRMLRSAAGSAAPLTGRPVLKAKGKALRKLRKKGKVKVKALLEFTPTNGSPLTARKSITLRLAGR
jgi:DNA-binding beta-propeller fold protein YncE